MTDTTEREELARVIAPGHFDGRPQGAQVRADAIELADAILAAGYTRRNDALEEAATRIETLAKERGWSGAKALGKLGIAATAIRALKSRT